MKLLEKKIILNQPGTVMIIPEEPDDLWLIYNLLAAGDTVSAITSRKIHLSSSDSGPKKNPSRVTVDLEIKITAVDYNKNSPTIRVRGKILVANEHVKAGAFHTLEIERNKEFNLRKQNWDEESINSLSEASDRTAGADLAVVLMHAGLAHIFSVGKTVTTLFSIDHGCLNPKIGANKFFQALFSAFNKHVDFNIVRCVVIGSPTSLKDEFRQYLLSEAHKLKMKSIENNKSRIVLVNTSSGNRSSLKEVLNDINVMNLVKDTKSAIEIRLFKEFMDMLSSNSDRACYGWKNVEMAQELMAIETLMITDDLFRNSEISDRQKYIGLVKSVKEAGGKALVLSAKNVSGEGLAKLTGIAAILRFPLPDLDEMEL